MVLSAALDSGYIFLSLVSILTSVIGGVCYLNITLHGNIVTSNILDKEDKVQFGLKNIVLSSSLTITISILTLITLLFMFMPTQ